MNNVTQLIFFSLLWSGSLCFAGDELSEALAKKLAHSQIKADEFGGVVVVRRGGEDHIVWSHRLDEQMIPASLTKLVSAGALLDTFGPSRKFETHLLSTAPIDAGVLRGNLVLRGGGDPGFVSESMWFLVNEFLRTGIREIRGDILVDDTRFDRVRNDSSRQEERVDRAYDAPVGALSFNWNSVNVFVRPAKKAGESAQVFLDPENDFVSLRGAVTTVKAGKKTAVTVERGESKGKDWVQVSGQIPVGAKEFVAYKNISEPDKWAGNVLIQFLKQRGISVTGKVVVGPTPTGAVILAHAESKPLGQLVADMLKFSNNFVAEMLVKNLAAEKNGMPAKLEPGIDLLRKFIVTLGVPMERFKFISPSGFNSGNRMTPKDLNQILVQLRNRFTVFPELLAALPLAGVDGTLKSRMRGTVAEGRVRAKTGLLTGVAGLAGYAGRRDGSDAVFTFIFNGRANQGEEARALFDQMAAVLVQ
jgi:serine-type D-Ala-D-Ala carboxypeptidase/endopeptidase (penicillin-binding protein 4)